MRDDERTYRLNGIQPPIGTMIGPDQTGTLLVVEAWDGYGVIVRRAYSEDGERMIRRILLTKETHSPRESFEFIQWRRRMNQ